MIVGMSHGQQVYNEPLTARQVAMDMGGDAMERTVCAAVDGVVVDLSYLIDHDCTLELLSLEDDRARLVYQHTAAHVLGQAAKAVFPTVKIVAATATKDGFCCDVVFAAAPDRSALARIEEEMRSLCRADLSIEREEMSRTACIKLMRRFGEIYRIQLVEALPKGTRVSVYRTGDFVDLSRGPHLDRTGRLDNVSLKAINRVMSDGKVWRIVGTALPMAQPADRPKAGKVRAVGARVPQRKRNNM